MSTTETIRAAGGVVVRRASEGVEVAIVHRPAYDDWTLPKGKCEDGESLEACALREVEEETGLHCELLGPVGMTSYNDRKGRPKEVSWWLMRPQAGELLGQSEVDVARWAAPGFALSALTYERDREMLEGLTQETRLWLVRHADAGDRSKWTQPDELRPLDDRGRRQAREIARILAGEGIERLVSSPYIRCVQTLEPLAELLRRPVEQDARLGEGNGLDGVEPLLIAGRAVAACTHGDVCDDLIAELQAEGLAGPRAKAQKGSTWFLRIRAGLVLSADYIRPPA